MQTFAVVNQKGGVGKTTVVLGLASAAQARGVPVLVVDLDPQANSTGGLGVTAPVYSANDVLYANEAGIAIDAVTTTAWPGVSVIPADLSLAARDSDQQLGAELRLRKALDSDELRQRFPLVLIDCQPSIGKLVSNALLAADGALIVTEPSIDASTGVENVLQTISTVQEYYNSSLAVAAVILNKVPARSREAAFRSDELRSALGSAVWEPPIPVRTVLAEARGAARPVHEYGARAADVTAVFDTYLDRLQGVRR